MITKVSFTSADRVREVISNFNADGFQRLYPATRVAMGAAPPRYGCTVRLDTD